MAIELTADQLDQLADALDNIQLSTESGEGIRANYSGRSMNGRQCIGYVGDNPTRFAFELAVILAIADIDEPDTAVDEHEIRDALDRIGNPRSDNMGRSTIWYWPNIRTTNTD